MIKHVPEKPSTFLTNEEAHFTIGLILFLHPGYKQMYIYNKKLIPTFVFTTATLHCDMAVSSISSYTSVPPPSWGESLNTANIEQSPSLSPLASSSSTPPCTYSSNQAALVCVTASVSTCMLLCGLQMITYGCLCLSRRLSTDHLDHGFTRIHSQNHSVKEHIFFQSRL